MGDSFKDLKPPKKAAYSMGLDGGKTWLAS